MNMRLIILCAFLCTVYFGHSTTYDASKSIADNRSAQFMLSSITSDIKLSFTSETKRLIDTYTYHYKPGAKRIMEREEIYFPSFSYKLEKFGLPQVLKNISIVESNLDVWSVSPKGAVGVWQLMPPIARAHGLKIDGYVDERLDPILSSEVAFTYLSDLFDYFKDWDLALTAYNCGPVKLRTAIRQVDSYDMNLIRKVLPKESSRYVSRFAAATYLSHYSGVHDIHSNNNSKDPGLGSIKVNDYITFGEIANITGLSQNEIVQYNPSVLYDFLPANTTGYHLNLPLRELIMIIETKGWSYSNIRDVHYLLPSLEKLISFVNPEFRVYNLQSSSTDENNQDNPDSSKEIAPLAVMRERFRGKRTLV